jgi:uncharacterized membrane protein YedE/YeeE
VIGYVVLGLLFGFVLSRAGATRFDAIQQMFLLEDLHLVGVILVAIAATAIGYLLFRRGTLRVRSGEPASLEPKPMQRGLLLGGLLFGAGWAISGACPGTALAQLGEGTISGAITLAGILLGTRARGWMDRLSAQR